MTHHTDATEARAVKQVFRDMLFAALVYLPTVLGGALAIKYFDPPQWVAALLAIAPIGPALLILRAQLRYTRSLDELHRRIHSEAMTIAAIVVAFATLGYGLLEDLADFPHISMLWVFPALCVVWSIANIFVRQKYL